MGDGISGVVISHKTTKEHTYLRIDDEQIASSKSEKISSFKFDFNAYTV